MISLFYPNKVRFWNSARIVPAPYLLNFKNMKKIVKICTNIDGADRIISVDIHITEIAINGTMCPISEKNHFSGICYANAIWDGTSPMREWIDSLPKDQFYYADPVLGVAKIA